MAGYSGTPLAQKLGVKSGHRLGVLGAPAGFDAVLAQTLPLAVTVRQRASGSLDVDGGLWIAWPKKASGLPTDVSEDTVRELFLPTGLVDNKVCAIDDVWSGLRVVWRKDRRDALRAADRVRPVRPGPQRSEDR